MSPTEKGRLCAACQKNIVDFSKMRWAEIEKLQGENGNSLCGMYSEKQLEYWGREVPAPAISRFARAAVFVLGLVGLQAQAQAQTGLPADSVAQKLLIEGFVTGKSFSGKVDTMSLASVRLAINGVTRFGQLADLDGYYRIILPFAVEPDDSISLTFSYAIQKDVEVSFRTEGRAAIRYDVQLPPRKWSKGDFYYVRKPTRLRMLWWRFKGIFSEDYRDIYDRYNSKKWSKN